MLAPAPLRFLFGGGGGGAGFFFARNPVAAAPAAPELPGEACSAAFSPAATWSPCRRLKESAVDAAARASDIDTDRGSRLNALAVWRAACFCAKVVPAGGGGEEEEDGEEVDPPPMPRPGTETPALERRPREDWLR